MNDIIIKGDKLIVRVRGIEKEKEREGLPNMKYCNKCGNVINEESTFCNNCGTQIVDNNITPNNEQVSTQVIQTPQKNNKKTIAIGAIIIVILLIVIASLVVLLLRSKNNSPMNNSTSNNVNTTVTTTEETTTSTTTTTETTITISTTTVNKKEQKTKELENQLITVGKDFYKIYYYQAGKDDEGRINYVKKYNEKGLKIDMVNLMKAYPYDNKYIDFDAFSDKYGNKCNYDNTMVVIFPIEPYGIDDYTISAVLDCEDLRYE